MKKFITVLASIVALVSAIAIILYKWHIVEVEDDGTDFYMGY